MSHPAYTTVNTEHEGPLPLGRFRTHCLGVYNFGHTEDGILTLSWCPTAPNPSLYDLAFENLPVKFSQMQRHIAPSRQDCTWRFELDVPTDLATRGSYILWYRHQTYSLTGSDGITADIEISGFKSVPCSSLMLWPLPDSMSYPYTPTHVTGPVSDEQGILSFPLEKSNSGTLDVDESFRIAGRPVETGTIQISFWNPATADYQRMLPSVEEANGYAMVEAWLGEPDRPDQSSAWQGPSDVCDFAEFMEADA